MKLFDKIRYYKIDKMEKAIENYIHDCDCKDQNKEVQSTSPRFMDKLKDYLFCDEESDEEIDYNILEYERKKIDNIDDSEYKISKQEAFRIANLNQNLKTDFKHNIEEHITYLSFKKYDANIITINSKKYWQIKVHDAEFGAIETDSSGTTFLDGEYTKEASPDKINKLSCLVDVDTGEYKYYPIIEE